MYANMLGSAVFSLLLQYLDMTLLRAATYEAGGPTRASGGSAPPVQKRCEGKDSNKDVGEMWSVASIRRRLLFGVFYSFDKRLTATPWEIKHVPRFDKNDVNHVPSRAKFLLNHTIRFFLAVLLLDLGRPSADASKSDELFAQDKVPFFSRLRSVTAEDVGLRFATSIGTATLIYLMFQMIYSRMALVCVGLYASPPERWRPFFGDVTDAWSLRRAWK